MVRKRRPRDRKSGGRASCRIPPYLRLLGAWLPLRAERLLTPFCQCPVTVMLLGGVNEPPVTVKMVDTCSDPPAWIGKLPVIVS